MATYNITEDPNNKWVKLITINTKNDIDISNDIFNITVKDQLEYFIGSHIKEGSTFELEELFKKDTFPTLEISNNAVQYARQRCFTCTTEENKNEEPVYPTKVKCPDCKGTRYRYLGIRQVITCPRCNGEGEYICPYCSGTGYAHNICSNDPMYTEQYVSNVLDYCNSDDDSLIKNGIQFWVDGVNKRTMYIRVVTKGKSTRTPDGYTIWDPAQNKYVDTGYVGFTIANFNITLNKNERLVFNCFLMPTVNMGDPIPYDEEYTVPSAWNEVPPLYPHVLSANIRTDYDWNNNYKGIDNLYVNNTYPKKSSAYYYEQDSEDEYGIYWSTNPPTEMESYPTPMYCVKSSAYITDYLKTGSATDLYLSSGDDIVSACRDFDFNSSSVNSYLINEYSKKRINLSSDFDTIIDGEDQVFLSANGYNIHDGIYCYEITQYIYDSSCSGIIRDNQVKLELEI